MLLWRLRKEYYLLILIILSLSCIVPLGEQFTSVLMKSSRECLRQKNKRFVRRFPVSPSFWQQVNLSLKLTSNSCVRANCHQAGDLLLEALSALLLGLSFFPLILVWYCRLCMYNVVVNFVSHAAAKTRLQTSAVGTYSGMFDCYAWGAPFLTLYLRVDSFILIIPPDYLGKFWNSTELRDSTQESNQPCSGPSQVCLLLLPCIFLTTFSKRCLLLRVWIDHEDTQLCFKLSPTTLVNAKYMRIWIHVFQWYEI